MDKLRLVLQAPFRLIVLAFVLLVGVIGIVFPLTAWLLGEVDDLGHAYKDFYSDYWDIILNLVLLHKPL